MKKFLLAPILTVLLVLSVVGIGVLMKPESVQAAPVAQAATCETSLLGLVCVRQEGNQIVVSVAGNDVASVPLADVVHVPTVTVALPSTVRVTLPRVTVTRPPVTVTLPRATVGRPQETVTVPGVSLPRQTVTLRLPQATTTVTLEGSQTVGLRTVTPTPQTARVTVTGSNGQPTQTSVTITPSPVVDTVTTPVFKERKIRVTIPQAIGFGIGALLIGLGLGLLALFVAYFAGYKDSDDAEKRNWAKFRKDMFGK